MAVRALSAALVATLVACAGPAPAPPPPPESPDLVRRHYDQSCRIDFMDRPAVRADEILDMAGLPEELSRVPAAPTGRSPAGELQWPTLDFIARYEGDGTPRLAGVWETTLGAEAVVDAERILKRRVRPLSGLLEPEGFRVVVELSPRSSIEIGSAVVCLPHVTHEPYRRPVGLPDEVTTWFDFRTRRPALESDVASVRVHLDRDGVVTALDSVAGGETAVIAAREIIGRLRFDPALRNGEAIPSSVVQSFRFRPGFLAGR